MPFLRQELTEDGQTDMVYGFENFFSKPEGLELAKKREEFNVSVMLFARGRDVAKMHGVARRQTRASTATLLCEPAPVRSCKLPPYGIISFILYS